MGKVVPINIKAINIVQFALVYISYGSTSVHPMDLCLYQEVKYSSPVFSRAPNRDFALRLRGGVKMLDEPITASVSAPRSSLPQSSNRKYKKSSQIRRPTKPVISKKRKKVLRGKEGWKASVSGRMDRDRARAAGLGAPRDEGEGASGKAWSSARRQLREEKELGADMRDMVPALEESVSEATEGRLRASGTNPGLHRLFRCYPTLRGSDSDGDAGHDGGAPSAGGKSTRPDNPPAAGGGGGRGGGGGAGTLSSSSEAGAESGADMGWADGVDSDQSSAPSSFAGF
jgi:hypothetical protein